MYSSVDKNYLREIFEYENGKLLWKVSKARRIKIGSEAGYISAKGYRQVEINGKAYYVHRLVWIWHNDNNGEIQIDHINNNVADNRIENLRPASNAQNSYNQSLAKNNTSGYKGVSWSKNMNKWVAHIGLDGKKRCLGYFERIEDAVEAYNLAATELFGKFAKINKENYATQNNR